MTTLHPLPHEAVRISKASHPTTTARSVDGIRRSITTPETAPASAYTDEDIWVRPQPAARRPSYTWLWYASRPLVLSLCFIAGIALHTVTIGSTQSMFYDSDEMPHSILGSTALDIHAHANGSTDLTLPLTELDTPARAGLDIHVTATTSAPFTYTLAADNREGECDAFTIETSINGAPLFNGPLADLTLMPPHAVSGSNVHDLINLIFTTPQRTTDTHCTFTLTITATNGFTDTETIPIHLTLPATSFPTEIP